MYQWTQWLVPRRARRASSAARSPCRRGRIRAPAAKRGPRHVFAALGLLVVAGAHGAVPEVALGPRSGHAYSLATGELVYRELHHPETADGRVLRDRVEYRGPDGALLARKSVDYRPDPVCPAFRLEDLRTGYVEGLEWSADGRPVLFHREAADASLERAAIAAEGLVADAGFDMLIYRELESLRRGARPVIPFAVPNRLDTVDFRLRRLDRRPVLGRSATVVRMEPANPLLRWLVEPIDVAYDAETGALLRYEGLSNLPNPDGSGNYRVRIDFPPAGAEPQPPAGETAAPRTGPR